MPDHPHPPARPQTAQRHEPHPERFARLAIAGAAGLTAIIAWLITPHLYAGAYQNRFDMCKGQISDSAKYAEIMAAVQRDIASQTCFHLANPIGLFVCACAVLMIFSVCFSIAVVLCCRYYRRIGDDTRLQKFDDMIGMIVLTVGFGMFIYAIATMFIMAA